jgi:hypothetical protein
MEITGRRAAQLYWPLHLLSSLDDDSRDKTLLLFWRAWHHRNDVMHGKGRASIAESVEFLKRYVVSIGGTTSRRCANLSKRSMKFNEGGPCRAKLNLDAGYCHDMGQAGCGVVVRERICRGGRGPGLSACGG